MKFIELVKNDGLFNNVTINMDMVESFHIGNSIIKFYMQSNAIVTAANTVTNMERLGSYIMKINTDK